MMTKEYFHLCSDGVETPDFITSSKDFIAAMNIVALCAASTGVIVIAFTLEDTHPHFFLYGTREECVRFKKFFEDTYCRYAARSRSDSNPFHLDLEIYGTGNDEEYVRNIAAYTVIQPTKDGKSVMPWDYLWGSGPLYFRSANVVLPWRCGKDGTVLTPVAFGTLQTIQKRAVTHSRIHTVPDTWLVCGGIILPSNYVDVQRFESIFRTHNCYRVFLSGSRRREGEILQRMASERGVKLDDLQARAICGEESKLLFGIRDPRRLDVRHRIILAQALRSKNRMTIRQIAKMIRLPESEVARYVP